MPAALQCVGDCRIFINSPFSPGTTAPRFLGHCERAPRILIHREYANVHNDPAGSVPADLSYQGQRATISLDLARFDAAVYDLIAQFPHTGTFPAGTDVAGDVGSLMITEGRHIGVWILFPYSIKATNVAAGMIAGYRLPFCFPVGPDDHRSLGTQPRILNLQFLGIRNYNASTGAQLLYDSNMAGLPAIN
jgi:hypothetical protein